MILGGAAQLAAARGPNRLWTPQSAARETHYAPASRYMEGRHPQYIQSGPKKSDTPVLILR